MDKLHQFYCSKAWRELSYNLKIARGGKCERTGEVFADLSQLIAHHKIELNESNVDNSQITLNPDNIEIISFKEHNKEHRRFGNKQNVYIIYGSPLSGKNTLARELMQYGDMVLDMDALWQAITFQEAYVKPKNCRFNIFAVRDSILDQIKTRYGQWYDAYIIQSLPEKYERERLSKELGAELIYCEATREECLKRRIESKRPEVWDKYINEWFEKYNG